MRLGFTHIEASTVNTGPQDEGHAGSLEKGILAGFSERVRVIRGTEHCAGGGVGGDKEGLLSRTISENRGVPKGSAGHKMTLH